jgi:hypothetical protein
MVIDIPPSSRGAGLALDRYYLVIIETQAELAEFERYLHEPRVRPTPPDLLDHRASGLSSDQVIITQLDPPEPGWPWVSICKWPDSFARAGREQNLPMARGAYTMESFETAEALQVHHAQLLQSLEQKHGATVRQIAGELLSEPGTA